MPSTLDILYQRDLHAPHVEMVVTIFRQMDDAYATVAGALEFGCTGCEDNCCQSLFYHHTLLEYLLLRTGFDALAPRHRERILIRAAEALTLTRERLAAGIPVKVMCPLNEEGRCVLYASRPMICRLHGVPHCLVRPDGRRIDGPGCHMVSVGGGAGPLPCLDRTPFYRALAGAEQACRAAYGEVPRVKMTLSELLLQCRPSLPGGAEEGKAKENTLEID